MYIVTVKCPILFIASRNSNLCTGCGYTCLCREKKGFYLSNIYHESLIIVVPGLLYLSWMYVCVFENKVFVNLGDRQSVGVQPWCLLTGPEAFWVVKLTSSYFQLT